MNVAHAAIRTPFGRIVVLLEMERAPLSAASFLAHADAGLYRGGSFYRAARPDNEVMPEWPAALIQGGFDFHGNTPLPRVAHEPPGLTGLAPLAGTIGLCRDEPGTAAAEFFINMADNPSMLGGSGRGDGAGVAIFGRVIEGMDIAHRIQGCPCGREAADIPAFAWSQLLREPVMIEDIARL